MTQVMDGRGGVQYLDPNTQTTHDSPPPPHLSWTLVKLDHSLLEWPQTVHLMSPALVSSPTEFGGGTSKPLTILTFWPVSIIVQRGASFQPLFLYLLVPFFHSKSFNIYGARTFWCLPFGFFDTGSVVSLHKICWKLSIGKGCVKNDTSFITKSIQMRTSRLRILSNLSRVWNLTLALPSCSWSLYVTPPLHPLSCI